ncbi:MAG: polysaccharide biosynthesis tyrosine autokinase [Arthrobacter sp.]|uniref:polysaccharide biosynthesis tyrosine autokinase n=1 Tax=Arthrobacter sp. TaxID=1667 RepID=UPI0034943696
MEPNDAHGAETGPDLRQYLTVARTYWRGIAAILLGTILLAFVWTLTQPKIYEAASSGMVVTAGADNIGTALAGDSLAKSKATSYKSIAQSRPVALKVQSELGLELTPDVLLGQIAVEVPTATAEIRVKAQSTDPAAAQDLADAWVEALAEQVSDIESSAMDAGSAGAAVQVAPLGRAALPTEPVSPNTRLALALGGVVGLALGLGYALLRNHLDRRVRSAEAVERLGSSVVGTIPSDARLATGRQVVESGSLNHDDRESHAFSESLRELRTNLSYMDVDNPPRIIVITSSVPGEGKSSISANLAVAIAATGRETILIDGDLRRPVLSDIFGLPSGGGLTDVLSGMADIDDVLQPYGPVPSLSLLAAGRIPPNPSELLGSRAMKNLLRQLSETAVVLIDAPPLLPVTDAAILTKSADGALVTVKAGSTTIDELGKALDNLRKVDAHVLGAILNQVPTKGAGADQYGYYGKYYYSAQQEPGVASRRHEEAIAVEAPVRAARAGVAPDRLEDAVHDAEDAGERADDRSFDELLTTPAQMRHLRRRG